jgi:hypothetical protein
MSIAEPLKLVKIRKYKQVIIKEAQNSLVQILQHSLLSKLSNNNKRRNSNKKIRVMSLGTQMEQIFKNQSQVNNLKNEYF